MHFLFVKLRGRIELVCIVHTRLVQSSRLCGTDGRLLFRLDPNVLARTDHQASRRHSCATPSDPSSSFPLTSSLVKIDQEDVL